MILHRYSASLKREPRKPAPLSPGALIVLYPSIEFAERPRSPYLPTQRARSRLVTGQTQQSEYVLRCYFGYWA